MSNVLPFTLPPKPEPILSAVVAETYSVGHATSPSGMLREFICTGTRLLELSPESLASALYSVPGASWAISFRPAMKELVEAIEAKVAEVEKLIQQR